MLKLIFSLGLVANSPAWADSQNNDFSRSETKTAAMTPAELRERFELLGEIFVTDTDGNLMYQADESRLWKFGKTGDLTSNWSYNNSELPELALRHVWTLSEKGVVEGHIRQFDSMKRKGNASEVETGKLLREDKFALKGFAPVSWEAFSDKKKKVIVRLTPRLADRVDTIQVKELPISLENFVVYDSDGNLWGEVRDLEGKYLGVKTHRGQIAISYFPFKGAREIGTVRGHKITLRGEKGLEVYIRSAQPILSTNRSAKIYGFINTGNRSEESGSIYSSSSGKEDEFLKYLR